MSSFVWMKVLESTPDRYDRGVELLSRGRIGAVREAMADRVARPGARILDVGCGTGGVSLACAARGAEVTGIDRDAGMLEVARDRAQGLERAPVFVCASAAEIEDHFGEASLDGVTACLVFSELSLDEQRYVLSVIRTRLRPGGLLVIADEVRPRAAWRRAAHRLGRLPLEALTYALTQTTTRPVDGLEARVAEAGFVDVEAERRWGDTFLLVRARRAATDAREAEA
ncbi:MAG: class I SAM-dependent methyltransferase [Myxococcales bacterium]|nr:class I SAM-dependent methyltransferase [Myxococcales bacterium]